MTVTLAPEAVFADPVEPVPTSGRRVFQLAVLGSLLYHGGLAFAGSWRHTYDAWVHIFFADHYRRSWFDLFEPRWYTGFSVASYPPAAHQVVAGLSWLVGLPAAYVIVQTLAVALLVGGVYRFSRLWVGERAAAFAALGVAFSTALAQTVHVFGQLPTVLGLALLLHATVPITGWLRVGDLRALVQGLAMVAATAAVHHFTILFGAVFFLGPLGLRVLAESYDRRRARSLLAPLGRGLLFGMLVFVAIGLVILPYWRWSTSDPIRQVPIPHGSRDDFFASFPSAVMFFLVPWGTALLGLGYSVVKGFRARRWPLAASVAVLTVLGLGGTTPVARLVLGNAFEVLALDRFTFWATVAVAPLLGELVCHLWDHGIRSSHLTRWGTTVVRVGLAGLLVIPVLVAANLPQILALQPPPVDPRPIAEFLDKDLHEQWRYLTLGLGDQMAGVSALADAGDVEGDYHSARRLPELTSSPIERLDGAKYAGEEGLLSLRQVLTSPDRYGLKYVFSADEFYDPLLHFTGWTRAARLRNGVVVWERAGVPVPSPPDDPGVTWEGIWWGLVPPLALLAGLLALGASSRWRARHLRFSRLNDTRLVRMLAGGRVRGDDGGNAMGGSEDAVSHPVGVPLLLGSVVVALVLVTAMVAVPVSGWFDRGPASVAVRYVRALGESRVDDAHDLLDPLTRPSYEDFLSWQSRQVGLDTTYTLVSDVRPVEEYVAGAEATVSVTTDRLDALSTDRVDTVVHLRRVDGRWTVEPPADVTAVQGDALEVSVPAVRFAVPQVPNERLRAELQSPTIEVTSARLVVEEDRLHLVGELVNTSGFPADVRVTASVRDRQGVLLSRYSAGTVALHQLRPGERTPYRIDFEGVSGSTGGTPLAHADLGRVELSVTSTITDQNLDRPLVLDGLVVGGAGVTGDLVNTGGTTVVVPRVLVTWYDSHGVAWVDAEYLRAGLAEGERQAFTVPAKAPSSVTEVDVPVDVSGDGVAPELETGEGRPRFGNGFWRAAVTADGMEEQP